ncbi:hypothetical protein RHS01_01984 [Rhizoctonia solani]|uniref:Uncharacterized protein n=1 Tax=Rhizoctonia solani TaxID=456999 RepID=A0A8H7M8A5_9AGAM|nr:hypothetical protein RHS01_01984 [Rhizoctonia solani]
MEPRKPYFFYFVTNGRTRSGAPIYNILKHTPSYLILASAIEMQGLYHTSGVHGGDSLCEQLSTRAKNNQLKRSTQSDLWHEAYSIKDGCSFVQYVDGPEYHIR